MPKKQSKKSNSQNQNPNQQTNLFCIFKLTIENFKPKTKNWSTKGRPPNVTKKNKFI